MKKTLLFGMLLLLGMFLVGVKTLKADDNEDGRSGESAQEQERSFETDDEQSQETLQQNDDSSAIINTAPSVINVAPSATDATPVKTQVAPNAVRDDNQNGVVDAFEELLP